MINITNTGAAETTISTPGQTDGTPQNNINGSICASMHTFAADEQEVSCRLPGYSQRPVVGFGEDGAADSTLTPSFPNEVAIKLIPRLSKAGKQNCNPATVIAATLDNSGDLTNGLLA